ncbi:MULTISPECIES: hypothetical protein [Halomonadaceae]|uniref:Uncharacterized protein n=1 Tax=Vreelandella titanicae TaxID=664683 RepID=A0AAP9NR66_9GAMM|nr:MULTISPECIES: hypothetical protein [Halomonas]QKS25537.1 hypothetical protein FX987_03333 [Halomonas titanicae]CDG53264.1 hypothetical protein HALA3H3_490048 [Halomonas sp. A3H3]
MTTNTSTRFSLPVFQKDLTSSDQRKLLHWADCELYAAFARNAAGHDEPVVMQVDSKPRYVASTSADTLLKLLAGAQIEEDSEAVVKAKPLTLAELARNAYLYRVGLHLTDGETGQYLEGRSTLALGMTAIVEPQEGKEVVYQAQVFSFEQMSEAGALPYGAVQYWVDSSLSHSSGQDSSKLAPIYVFDDQLDWRNPLFPELPDGAKPLNTLSPSEQAFFERMRRPLLLSWDEASIEPIVPESPYRNSLIEENPLSHFNKLRALINHDIVPSANDISLNVTAIAPLKGEPADTPERWELMVSFTMPTGMKALFEPDPDWIPASLFKANAALPDTTGIHIASEALRERIVNHLAWSFFQKGRSFDMARFSESLDGLLPGEMANSDEFFQPDYSDGRFPCLARFQCGQYRIPMLLLGQRKGNYICKPLKYMSIPEVEVPASIPQRNELINTKSQSMSFLNYGDKLALPTSLIDFPEHWYDGSRVSNQYLTSEFTSNMRVNILLNELEQTNKATASSFTKWVIASCAVVIIGVIVVMNL